MATVTQDVVLKFSAFAKRAVAGSGHRSHVNSPIADWHFGWRRDGSSDGCGVEIGNSPAVIFEHYRAFVTPETEEKFWKLLRARARLVVVEFAA